MTDDNTPDGTVDFEETDDVSALADILDDPATDTEEDEAQTADDEDEDPDDSEDSTDETDDDDDEPEATGGKFVGDTARIRLSDGTTTTVEELKKGFLRQSHFTQNSQRIAEERKAVTEKEQRVGETLQHLEARQEAIESLLEQWKPKLPAENDPLAFQDFQRSKIVWEEWEKQISEGRQQLEWQRSSYQNQATQERLSSEFSTLVEKFPAMSDPSKRTAFQTQAAKIGEKFGYSADEIAGIQDHRQILLLRELMRLQSVKANVPDVQEELGKKPQSIRGSKRGQTVAKTRQAATKRLERLHNEGSVEAGTESLMDLDL